MDPMDAVEKVLIFEELVTKRQDELCRVTGGVALLAQKLSVVEREVFKELLCATVDAADSVELIQ